MNMKKIFEAKDLIVYKKLITILGEFVTKFPASGVDQLFNTAIEQGKKILPKDKKALDILNFVLNTDSIPSSVQKLLNMRFDDLPVEYKPMAKKGRKLETACWIRNAVVSDKIKDLIDFQVTGKSGAWSDNEGNKVSIVDIGE